MDGWTDDLTSLFLLRDSLEGVVSADDLTVLQDRLQLLQRQWEEICHQVDTPGTHIHTVGGYTLPFKSLGTLRNVLVFEREAHFLPIKIT